MAHQALALKRYREKNFAPLFFEAGCGKSATALRMAKERFDAKEIDSLLIIAPNKIHKNVWYKEQVPMWLDEATVIKEYPLLLRTKGMMCLFSG
jgi:superfamily II DNA or RNA helicase